MINLPEYNATMIEVLTDVRVTAELHRPPEHEHSQALNHSPTSFFSIAFHLPQWALVYISPQPRTVIYRKKHLASNKIVCDEKVLFDLSKFPQTAMPIPEYWFETIIIPNCCYVYFLTACGVMRLTWLWLIKLVYYFHR